MKKILIITLLGFSTMIYHSSLAGVATPCNPANGDSDSNCWPCGDDCVARLNGGKLTVAGSGAMDDGSWGNFSPWYSKRSSITSLEISDKITHIGEYAFFRSNNLTSVTIPDSVTEIGKAAFGYNTKLQSLTIPNKLETVGDNTFTDLYKLKTVTIPDSVKLLDIGAFACAWELESVVFGENSELEEIKHHAFVEAYKLENIVIPKSVKIMNPDAFQDSNAKVYCSSKQVDDGVCDLNSMQEKGFKGSLFSYEKEGNHYNIYDANGRLISQYGSMTDFGTNNFYEGKRIYTVDEATKAVKGNKNTFSIRYR